MPSLFILLDVVHWYQTHSGYIRLMRTAAANHYLFLSHFKFTDSANCTVWFRKEKYPTMGLGVLNKHHCNSGNAFTVCFISASAKNTYRAGLIPYGIILNLDTIGETRQLIIEWGSIEFFCVCYDSLFYWCMPHKFYFIFWPLTKRDLDCFPLQMQLHFHLDSTGKWFKIFLKRTESFRGKKKKTGKFKERRIIIEVRHNPMHIHARTHTHTTYKILLYWCSTWKIRNNHVSVSKRKENFIFIVIIIIIIILIIEA